MSENKLLTTKELAQRWALSERSIYNMRSAGRFPVPAVKIGGAVRFRLIDVETYEFEGVDHE